MGIEARPPYFAGLEAPKIEINPQEIIAKVFLPFSDLHWMNLKRLSRLRKLDPAQDVDWLEKDSHGNPMLGNISGEVYWAVNSSLSLMRLHEIRALSLLAFSRKDEKNFYSVGSEFPQTRLFHTFLTTRVLEYILRNNNSPSQEINLGIMAGLTHDLATPALGDPTKEIDPDNLSEEKALSRLLNRYDLSALERLGFEKEKLLAIVSNEGVIGQLLDIADKIAYTSVDLYFYAGHPSHFPDQGPLNVLLAPIRKILSADPNWANLYREVVTETGEPYFKNSKRLGRFLELRALMHQALYLNPHCRGRDRMYQFLLLPLYSKEASPDFPFNPENLMFYTDKEAGDILNNYWKIMIEGMPFEHVLGILPNYVAIKNPAEIPQAVKALEQRGLLPIAAETIREFDPAVNFLTIDPKDEKIKPYSQVNPRHSRHLRQLVTDCNRTVIYYWPESTLIDEVWGNNLKKVIAELISQARQKNNGQIPYYQLY